MTSIRAFINPENLLALFKMPEIRPSAIVQTARRRLLQDDVTSTDPGWFNAGLTSAAFTSIEPALGLRC